MWQRLAVSLALALSISSSLAADNESHTDQSHKVISERLTGDDFRHYITRHIDEQTTWSQAMRTFGSLHNFMHELMTAMARHGALERADAVPEFEHSISGQKWRDYREALAKDSEPSVWSELVQVTELMHERVHHTMVSAVLYDAAAFDRGVDLADYLGDQTLASERAAGEPQRLQTTSLDEFRELVWNYHAERRHWHSAMQQAVVFAHMTDDLLTQWLMYGAGHEEPGCRPAEGAHYQRGMAWADYVARIANCTDSHWRDLVQEAGVMRERIHQMLHLMTNYRDWSVPTSLSLPALPSLSRE